MKQFTIYHPKNNRMNHNCDKQVFEYEEICSLSCYDINKAFMYCQNDFNNSYADLNKRSTSIGDIIINETTDKHYMVKGLGFEEISRAVVNFVSHKLDFVLHGDMANEFNDMQEEDYWNGDESDNFLQ